ncbi:aldo/keto reductase [Haloglycomyces albus]|uniref:aldo/keto reductase n=1 Tax=Haloglycomyces albus TaxID=526067 RepID=UPI00046C8BA3|nr:aldo/keto reductase [Haloglycomyces albus]
MTELSDTVSLHDGRTLPHIGFGTWRLDDDSGPNAVSTAIDLGYRFLDTAELYRNEEAVREGVEESGHTRGDVIIQSKVWNNHQGYDATRQALEASLERLGTDYLDLYLIHWPAPQQDLYVDTWKSMLKAQDEGLIRSIGVSNFLPQHIERLVRETGQTPAVNQIELHPYFNQADLRSWHAEAGIPIQCWGPLGHRSGNLFEEKTLTSIAAEHGKTPAQIVLRWHLQHGLLPIPKSQNPDRIRQNLELFDFALNDAEMTAIDRLDTGKRQGDDPATFG